MYTQPELSQIVEKYLSQLHFPQSPRRLYEPIEYSLESGGKRLRPVIVLMACNLFAEDVERALPCAAAIEVFHNFTLLHDDIMDNADVRRGRPSVHKKWSPNTAILSGDAMMIYSYSLLESVDASILPRVFGEFNKMAMEVCEGQQYDMDFEEMDDVSLDHYITMIELKTAALIARAAKIGAMVGGADEKSASHVYDFCKNVGIAFQIQDDILDTYGDDKTLGKKVGGDILEAKKTFLMINALDFASSPERSKLIEILNDKSMPSGAKIDSVRKIYDRLGVKEVAERAVAHYMSRAVESLDVLDLPSERTAELKKVAIGLLNRKK